MVLPLWAFWIALAVMLVGLIGVILPVVPGVILIWLAVLVYAIAENFATIDPITFAVITLLGAAGATSELWMSQTGARMAGASLRSQLIGLATGVVGAIIGGVFFGVGAVPGALIGSLLGIFLAERWRCSNWREALRSTGGWLLGWALSTLIQFLIGAGMIAIFAWQAFRG